MLALVRTGVGIAVLPRLSISAWREGPAFLPLDDPSARRFAGLITRSIARSAPAADAFVGEFRRVLKDKAAQLGIGIIG